MEEGIGRKATGAEGVEATGFGAEDGGGAMGLGAWVAVGRAPRVRQSSIEVRSCKYPRCICK